MGEPDAAREAVLNRMWWGGDEVWQQQNRQRVDELIAEVQSEHRHAVLELARAASVVLGYWAGAGEPTAEAKQNLMAATDAVWSRAALHTGEGER
jgi:hypothetical protein